MLLPVSSLGDLERGHTSESEAGYSLLAPHIVVMSPKPETLKTPNLGQWFIRPNCKALQDFLFSELQCLTIPDDS